MSVVIPAEVIAAAQDAQKATDIPASVSIAQWAAESGWGAKVTGTYNYFGVKAVPGQPFTMCPTHEMVDGRRVPIEAAFVNYSSLEQAFVDHARLLCGPRYAAARACLPDVSAFVDKMAPVYATDPTYAGLLNDIIRQHDLTRYDA